MKLVCTKCRSESVYIEQEPQVKESSEITIDECVQGYGQAVPLVYKPTVWKCKECGYSVAR